MAKGRRGERRALCGAFVALFGIVSTAAMAWDRPQWIRQLGTSEQDFSFGVATDVEGNVYISGVAGGLLAGSDRGAFIAKYSDAGALLWISQLAGHVSEGVAIDGDGNAYISGFSFDSSSFRFVAWLAKYSEDGVLRWKRRLGTSDTDYLSAGVASDDDGGAFMSGTLGAPYGAGADDAWLAKYSKEGELLWTRGLGTPGNDNSNDVATDADGNVYIAGSTTGSLGGDQQGNGDAWVAKYSAHGTLRWQRQLGTPFFDLAEGVATDKDGDVYLTGLTGGSMDGRPQGDRDAWVAKYSAAGVLRWKRQLGTYDFDDSNDVATDQDGNVYISGFTEGSLGGVQEGGSDAWVAKYSTSGALRWKRQLGTASLDNSESVATDGKANLYLTGWTQGSLGGANRGQHDIWVAKYFTRR